MTIFGALLAFKTGEANNQKPIELLIESTYKKTPHIWGTYRLIEERSSFSKVGQKKGIVINRPQADIVLNQDSMVFINPVKEQGQTIYKVSTLKYNKKPGSKYHLRAKTIPKELKEVFRPQIELALKANNRDTELPEVAIELKEASCRKRKQQIKCRFPISINQN